MGLPRWLGLLRKLIVDEAKSSETSAKSGTEFYFDNHRTEDLQVFLAVTFCQCQNSSFCKPASLPQSSSFSF